MGCLLFFHKIEVRFFSPFPLSGGMGRGFGLRSGVGRISFLDALLRRGVRVIREGDCRIPSFVLLRSFGCSGFGDEDKNLGRVGSLERGKPIFLLQRDSEARISRSSSYAHEIQVRERRPHVWCGHGRRGEHPREVKTQERIGSICSGNP
jgi:hypothetical protein